jgi:hypothetical protein
MDMSIFRDPNRPSWVTLSGMLAAEEHLAREAASVQSTPPLPAAPSLDDGAMLAARTTAAALELVAAARARAAHFAEVMRTPSCVGMPVQPRNVAADWSAIIAKVEAEQPRDAMTPQTASADQHGWSQIFAAVAAENAVSSTRPGGSNHGWAEAFLNAKS